MIDITASSLNEKVVQGGYCIGCGVCTAVEESPFSIKMNKYGCYEATLDRESNSKASLSGVCPFDDTSSNEDEIGKQLFSSEASYHDKIGFNIKSFAGYVKEGAFRKNGSSGGFGKWISHELVSRKMVDAVIHVEQNTEGEALYKYKVVHDEESLKKGSKSVYYPVEMSEVLAYVKDNPGKYALVGVPCFIKAVRLLSNKEEIYKERIKYFIGLVCGHLKSKSYGDLFGWQAGIKPGNLEYIDFRKKLPGAQANQKGVEVIGKNYGEEVRRVDIVQNLFGSNYGHGFFKYKACDFCDDVLAETADIVVGDAWIPQYISDGMGTNVLTVRSRPLLNLIEEGISDGRLHLDVLPPDLVAKSQDGGLRHRREGLSYRLYLQDREKEWRPLKRVNPGKNHLNKKRRRIYKTRTRLAENSHKIFDEAIDKGDFYYFYERMNKIVAYYNKLYWGSGNAKLNIITRIYRRARGMVKKFV